MNEPTDGIAFLQTWMRTPNPMLGDMKPLDLMQMGKGDRVALFIEAAHEAESPPPAAHHIGDPHAPYRDASGIACPCCTCTDVRADLNIF